MDLHQLLKKHANMRFSPHGQDDMGVYMVVDSCRIHLRFDDYQMASGLPLSEVWPLVDNIKVVEM